MSVQGNLSNTFPVPNAAAGAFASSLGAIEQVPNSNGDYRWEVLLYVPSALQGNLAQGTPYYLNFVSTAGQYLQPATMAGNATSGTFRQLVVLQDSAKRTGTMPTTGAYGWFAFKGVANVLVDGTTDVAAGNYLLSNSKTISGALILDGTTKTDESVGMALAAQATDSAVLTSVFLFGDPAKLA